VGRGYIWQIFYPPPPPQRGSNPPHKGGERGWGDDGGEEEGEVMYDRAGRWKFCVQLLSVVGKVTDPTVTSHSNILLVLQSKEVTVPLYNQSFFSS
jgi:hypothetical protein